MRHLYYRAITSIAMTTCCFAVLAQSCRAEEVSEARIVSLIRTEKIVKSDFPLRVMVDGNDLTVQTKRGAKSKDKACKIDAMLIAKAVLDTFPKSFKSIKVLFAHDWDDKFDRIVVQPDLVEQFGSGKLTEEAMLDSLQLSAVEPRDSAKPHQQEQISVGPGPLREQRLMLADRIESLKRKGVGVKPYLNLYTNIESLVQAGKQTEASSAIEQLAERLKDQESLLHQATKVQQYSPDQLRLGAIPARQSSIPPQSPSKPPSPEDIGARLDQIWQVLKSRPSKEQLDLAVDMSQIARLVTDQKLSEADAKLRTLEKKLGCSIAPQNGSPK